MIKIIFILSFMLFCLIMIQPEKGEALGTAFMGQVHRSKIERKLSTSTYILIFVIIAMLFISRVIR